MARFLREFRILDAVARLRGLIVFAGFVIWAGQAIACLIPCKAQNTVLGTRPACRVARLVATCASQAILARLARPIQRTRTITSIWTFGVTLLSPPTVLAAFVAAAVLVARAAHTGGRALLAHSTPLCVGAWVRSLFALGRSARLKVAAADGSVGATLVAIFPTEALSDSGFAAAIFLEALVVNASVGAFFLALASPPLMWFVFVPRFIVAAFETLSSRFITTRDAAFLAIVWAFLVALIAPSVFGASVLARASFHELPFVSLDWNDVICLNAALASIGALFVAMLAIVAVLALIARAAASAIAFRSDHAVRADVSASLLAMDTVGIAFACLAFSPFVQRFFGRVRYPRVAFALRVDLFWGLFNAIPRKVAAFGAAFWIAIEIAAVAPFLLVLAPTALIISGETRLVITLAQRVEPTHRACAFRADFLTCPYLRNALRDGDAQAGEEDSTDHYGQLQRSWY
jgi:hypothetical protein